VDEHHELGVPPGGGEDALAPAQARRRLRDELVEFAIGALRAVAENRRVIPVAARAEGEPVVQRGLS